MPSFIYIKEKEYDFFEKQYEDNLKPFLFFPSQKWVYKDLKNKQIKIIYKSNNIPSLSLYKSNHLFEKFFLSNISSDLAFVLFEKINNMVLQKFSLLEIFTEINNFLSHR